MFEQKTIQTARHRTAWIGAGPPDGPLMIFVHGWPELGLFWRAQIEHFAAQGWQCVAPDMRGYGGSSTPDSMAAYAVRELVTDMVELHDELGGTPALWVGHDWGSAVVWAIASHHAERCRGVVNLCIPYLSRGLALPTLVPLIDRGLYPVEQYPVGQWDYWLFYRQHFARAAQAFEADVEATFSVLARTASKEGVGKPSLTAAIRAQGGWFGDARRAPAMRRDELLMCQVDFDAWVTAFRATGFGGANAWYMNDAENVAFAAEAPRFGRLDLPVLFLHAERDVTCDTVRSRLADPMRADCADLTEVSIDGGHELMLERPAEVNAAITQWLATSQRK
jgi:pimeloyl-ACP methyl ester carboxylesterase